MNTWSGWDNSHIETPNADKKRAHTNRYSWDTWVRLFYFKKVQYFITSVRMLIMSRSCEIRAVKTKRAAVDQWLFYSVGVDFTGYKLKVSIAPMKTVEEIRQYKNKMHNPCCSANTFHIILMCFLILIWIQMQIIVGT